MSHKDYNNTNNDDDNVSITTTVAHIVPELHNDKLTTVVALYHPCMTLVLIVAATNDRLHSMQQLLVCTHSSHVVSSNVSCFIYSAHGIQMS